MKVFNYSCQGESHKADDKPCQDASRAEIISDDFAVCVISDGHGGDRYFRSRVGSQILVDITFEKVHEFVGGMSQTGLLKGIPFTQMGIHRDHIEEPKAQIDQRFMQLFRAIKAEWMIRIFDHASNTPANEWEREHVKPSYLVQLESKEKLEKIYGATLMAYVRTPEFWFAFHLGDGKMIMFDKNGDGSEPVLWDSDCFLNVTSSICSSDAVERFRYSYQGDGVFPFAMFLGSDGIDDSFTDGEPLYDFYIGLLREIDKNGDEAVQNSLVESLPVLSAKGSRDDMSVAYCYEEEILDEVVLAMTKKQIERFEDEFRDTYKSEQETANAINLIEKQYPNLREEIDRITRKSDELAKKEAELIDSFNSITKNKEDLGEEMNREVQRVRDKYSIKIQTVEESLQDKGAEIQDAKKKRADISGDDFKDKKRIYIDLEYKKKDLANFRNLSETIITRMNRLREFVGEEPLTTEDMIKIYNNEFRHETETSEGNIEVKDNSDADNQESHE